VREARLKAEGKGVWSGVDAKGPPALRHKLFSPRTGFIAAVAADSDWRLYTCSMKH
jgi:hypothetical protein